MDVVQLVERLGSLGLLSFVVLWGGGMLRAFCADLVGEIRALRQDVREALKGGQKHADAD